MENFDGLSEKDRQRRNHHRKVIAFKTAVTVSAVFLAIMVFSDISKAVKSDGEKIKKEISETADSYLLDPEDIQNAADEFKKNILPELNKELEDEEIPLPEIKEDETTSLPVLENNNFYSDIPQEKEIPSESGTLLRVEDCETLIANIDDKEYRIRLIGIDVPETRDLSDYDKEVSPETTIDKLLADKLQRYENNKIKIEYGTPAYDRYGRLLGYVSLSDDTIIQNWLIENGYAKISGLSEGDLHYKVLFDLQQKAQKNKAGFWNGYFDEE